MTEHSKIPVPLPDGEQTPQHSAKVGPTLIERVVRNYDLVKFTPAPIPGNLIPPASKHPRYRRGGEHAVEAEFNPPSGHEPPREISREARSAKLKGVALEAEVVVAPGLVAEPPVAMATITAAQFKGGSHKVSRPHLREQGLIVPEGSVTGLLEEFRIVKRQLLLHAVSLAQQGMGEAAQRILICSPHPGEGKTYTAVNLALAIAAEKEREVVLVDADFAKPSVLSALGLPGGSGLMDALADPSIDVAECVIGTDISGLWVLPAGNATTTDSEYLSSSHTRMILDRLTLGAPNRIVIFDSPPALAASPAAELANYVGQAVLVARADKTGQGALEDAVKLLSACPNIQLLLNAVHFSPSGRRFGSYYGYGG